MSKKEKGYFGDFENGSGIAIGLALGIVFGLALDNLAIGIALGVAFGAAFGNRGKTKQKNVKRDNDDEENNIE